MQRVGELILEPTKANVQPGEFQGQQLTFLGLNNAGLHNLVFRPLLAAWQEYTGAEIEWIDLPQAEIFPRIQQSIASGTVDFDILEGGAPWEGDILGRGLAAPMPDWVAEQIDMSRLCQAAPGPSRHLGRRDLPRLDRRATPTTSTTAPTSSPTKISARSGPRAAEPKSGVVPQTWQQVQAVTQFLNGKQIDGEDLYGILDVCAPGGGFSWYFFASRATAYAKHPDNKAWLFDPETMTPYVNNPAFVRAAQDIIDALPFEPADQVNADLNVTLV